MEVQIAPVIRDKILTAVETLPPALTRRDAVVPGIKDKAMTVIGMRRSPTSGRPAASRLISSRAIVTAARI